MDNLAFHKRGSRLSEMTDEQWASLLNDTFSDQELRAAGLSPALDRRRLLLMALILALGVWTMFRILGPEGSSSKDEVLRRVEHQLAQTSVAAIRAERLAAAATAELQAELKHVRREQTSLRKALAEAQAEVAVLRVEQGSERSRSRQLEAEFKTLQQRASVAEKKKSKRKRSRLTTDSKKKKKQKRPARGSQRRKRKTSRPADTVSFSRSEVGQERRGPSQKPRPRRARQVYHKQTPTPTYEPPCPWEQEVRPRRVIRRVIRVRRVIRRPPPRFYPTPTVRKSW